MSYSDEEFYTIDGIKITREYLVQKMIDYFNEKYPDADITDFNNGSVIRNILESISADIFHLEYNDLLLLTQAFVTTANGGYLELHGEGEGVTRKIALQARGTVTFSIPEKVNYLITIPQFTRFVDTATGLYYETNITCEIPIGETSVNCPVYSVVAGAGTNIPAECEFLFYDQNQFKEVTISNDAAFTGGRDAETDEDYRARIITAKTSDGFGSKQYYLNLGIIDGVHDIYIVDSDNGYDGNVIVNGFDKPITDNLLAQVTAIYTNEENLVYKHTFEVNKAELTTVPLEIEMGVTDEIQDQIIENILVNYFNGGILNINGQQFTHKGVNINEKITNYELMTLVESIDGVVQVTSLTSDDTPFNKLTPDTDTVLKLGTVTITQTVAD